MAGTAGAGYHQGTLASAIGRLTGEKVLPQGSGRTDAGVHALSAGGIVYDGVQYSGRELAKSAQRHSSGGDPSEGCERGLAEFHARKSARGRKRTAIGCIAVGYLPPFLARYVWHYPFPLDEAAMIEAACAVVGEHDFTSFAAVDAEKEKLKPRRARSHTKGFWRRCAEIFVSSWAREAD